MIITALDYHHTAAVTMLCYDQLLRAPDGDALRDNLARYPAVGAWRDGHLIGMCYTTRFAPDVLEITNIVVAHAHRNAGIGAGLLDAIEDRSTDAGFTGLIAVNSDLYPDGIAPSRPATRFYLKAGYRLVAQTCSSRVFFKNVV